MNLFNWFKRKEEQKYKEKINVYFVKDFNTLETIKVLQMTLEGILRFTKKDTTTLLDDTRQKNFLLWDYCKTVTMDWDCDTLYVTRHKSELLDVKERERVKREKELYDNNLKNYVTEQ